MEGTVKFFKTKKGWGFIKGEDEKEYFVHYSQIKQEGFKNIDREDKVEFDVIDCDKGQMAGNVRIIEKAKVE